MIAIPCPRPHKCCSRFLLPLEPRSRSPITITARHLTFPPSRPSRSQLHHSSRALPKWIVNNGIGRALIEPIKPWQNGVNESFNGKFRDECLSLEWFRSRAEAKVIIEKWRRHYNAVRPHSSLGYQTPAEFAAKLKEQASASSRQRADAAVHGLRAPARCITAPQGESKQPARAAVSS
jgi:putative transposase